MKVIFAVISLSLACFAAAAPRPQDYNVYHTKSVYPNYVYHHPPFSFNPYPNPFYQSAYIPHPNLINSTNKGEGAANGNSFSQGSGNDFPQSNGNSFSQGNGNGFPQGTGNSFSQGSGNSFSQDSGNSSPQDNGNNFAQGNGNGSPQGSGTSFSQDNGNNFAQGNGNGSPQGSGNSFSQGNGNGSPQGSGNGFPQGGLFNFPLSNGSSGSFDATPNSGFPVLPPLPNPFHGSLNPLPLSASLYDFPGTSAKSGALLNAKSLNGVPQPDQKLKIKIIGDTGYGTINIVNPFIAGKSADSRCGKLEDGEQTENGTSGDDFLKGVSPFKTGSDPIFGPEIAPKYEIHYTPENWSGDTVPNPFPFDPELFAGPVVAPGVVPGVGPGFGFPSPNISTAESTTPDSSGSSETTPDLRSGIGGGKPDMEMKGESSTEVVGAPPSIDGPAPLKGGPDASSESTESSSEDSSESTESSEGSSTKNQKRFSLLRNKKSSRLQRNKKSSSAVNSRKSSAVSNSRKSSAVSHAKNPSAVSSGRKSSAKKPSAASNARKQSAVSNSRKASVVPKSKNQPPAQRAKKSPSEPAAKRSPPSPSHPQIRLPRKSPSKPAAKRSPPNPSHPQKIVESIRLPRNH